MTATPGSDHPEEATPVNDQHHATDSFIDQSYAISKAANKLVQQAVTILVATCFMIILITIGTAWAVVSFLPAAVISTIPRYWYRQHPQHEFALAAHKAIASLPFWPYSAIKKLVTLADQQLDRLS